MFESIAGGMLGTLSRFDDAMLVIGILTATLVALFVVSLVLIARRRAPAFYRSAPTLLTTIGIMGTFLGISTGLMHFDATNIESSIPMLLGGLKIAFITSITGILLAVCLRLVLVLSVDAEPRTRLDADGSTTATDEPAASLDLTTLLQRQTTAAEAQLVLTHQLVGQMTRLDEHLMDRLERQHDEVLAAMSGFAAQLSEMGSRQLITALESVIRDFNSNLGEQFGENFRRLDESVAKLLRWQDQYREHMDVLARQVDHAIEGVVRSESALQSLTQQARQISTHIEDQEATLTSLRREGIELETLLGSIADLRERAKEAFPAIDQRLKLMLETIENAVLSALNAQQRLDRHGLDAKHLVSANEALAAGAGS